MGIPYQFGGYSYRVPTAQGSYSIILDHPDSLGARLRVADAPGSIDQYTEGGLPAARRITLSGHLFALGTDDLDALWDTFVAAHAPGAPQKLYLAHGDRYLLAEVESVKDVNRAKTIGSTGWEVTFVCQKPLWWMDALTTVAGTVAGGGASATIALPVSGTAPGRAVISVSLSAVGAIASGATYPPTTSLFTVTNAATGQAATFWARSTTGSIIIDGTTETVLQNGADAGAILLSGPWLDLVPGVTNNLTITASGGASLASAAASCQGRRY